MEIRILAGIVVPDEIRGFALLAGLAGEVDCRALVYHGGDYRTSRQKAVALQRLESLYRLKNFMSPLQGSALFCGA
jgi:hypothetical protein